MKKKTLAVLLGGLFVTATVHAQAPRLPVESVDPFLGTGGHGHVYPGATVPFGMVQLTPVNGRSGWDWSSGYHHSDSLIAGFVHTALSGTGIGDLLDVLVMPTSQPVDFTAAPREYRERSWATTYRKPDAEASPGYFRVDLDNGIRAELTATERVGVHRYTFPPQARPTLVVDLSFAVNWDWPTSTAFRVVNDTLVTGLRLSSGWARDQRVFFAMVFSQPLTGFQLADSTAVSAGRSLSGVRGRAQLSFAPSREPLIVRVGLSSASVAGAVAAVRHEAPAPAFERYRDAAQQSWSRHLGRIEIDAADSIRTVFYTALYRTMLAPVRFDDALGQFKGGDGQIGHTARPRYSIFSLWDTFRSAHPLYTLVVPERVNDMMASMVAFYDETGLLPDWELLGNETNTMIGYHAIPVLLDAFNKGFRGFDLGRAWAAVAATTGQEGRDLPLYRQYGFLPADRVGESASKTVEFAYGDWAAARLADALGHPASAADLDRRAGFWRNLLDPQTGFLRGRNADSTWLSPFDPGDASHRGSSAAYTEGNAWQYTWFVPHDVAGLMQAMGGRSVFLRRLDSLFTVEAAIDRALTPDITGLIGQYAQGNEPSHHVAYLYSYAGQPWRTAERVRQILLTLYGTGPEGLPGNEDCGQMSAWYVLSAMGFHPVNPAEGTYVFGSPIVREAVLHLSDGKTFTVRAPRMSTENKYIQAVRLNGQPLNRVFLYHAEITEGGVLEFDLGPRPNRRWGTAPSAWPPSVSPNRP